MYFNTTCKHILYFNLFLYILLIKLLYGYKENVLNANKGCKKINIKINLCCFFFFFLTTDMIPIFFFFFVQWFQFFLLFLFTKDKMDGFVPTHFIGWWLKVSIFIFLSYLPKDKKKKCVMSNVILNVIYSVALFEHKSWWFDQKNISILHMVEWRQNTWFKYTSVLCGFDYKTIYKATNSL